MGVSDEALVAGMAARDPQATASFVRRFQARVFGLAVSVVGATATAEDVAQEAFVRAWRYAGGYDPRRGAVLPWLLSITRNAAIDAIRLRRDRPYEPEVMLALLTAAGNDTSEPTDEVADADRIRVALRALPPEQATAVVLAIFHGLTAKEIAERQGLPLGTVKTRIRLGMSRLRDHFEVRDE
ncbi:RNA polymerase sigma-70 factor, ECF subfamily [Micromonospora rhizosphaerae]|uniref:RNA polymerase sigma factor n=1 Tax=Micromonospora rhizosphaerae TaxID=568872 RepID=A0A1C6SJH3_9ACTN|nr:sigma-70 family RNA polymerase sigma factor [Micromonospora rhizosphaerae]SCL29568.1 RNA polymerase sigma-70 factor, ECF subfamily [Micromonospora rhizosphaerae]